MALPADHVRRVVYGKYLLRRAEELLRKKTLLSAGEALLALQDGAEMLMRVVGDHLGLPARYDFLEFWPKVKEKTGTEPPHKPAMDRVNVARVGFKHKGNAPDRTLVSGFQPLVQEFCIDICDQYLDHLDFEKVTLATLISSDKVRGLVQESESLFEAGSHGEALGRLALAFSQLYSTAQRDAEGLLMEPPRVISFPSSSEPKLREMLKTGQELLRDHDKLAETMNILLLGIDPRAFLFFRKTTPHVFRMGDGSSHVTWPYGMPFAPVEEATFATCRDFVIEFSLRNDELFRP